jgi:hypothetical protein
MEESTMIHSKSSHLIEYGFWQDQLSNILITFTGFSNFDTVRAATEARFGKPRQPNRYLDEYYWFGKVTTMSIRYSRTSNNGVLRMSSNQISKKQEEYREEKAKKGAEKGF